MSLLKRLILAAAIICHLLMTGFALLKADKLAKPIITGKLTSAAMLPVKEKKALIYMLVCDFVLFYFASFIDAIIVEGESAANALLYSAAFVVKFVRAYPNGLVLAWGLLLFIMHRCIDGRWENDHENKWGDQKDRLGQWYSC